MLRNETSIVKIKNIEMGGHNKILIQSMCNIKTEKVDEVVNQIHQLEKAGCDLIRVSVLDENDAYAIKDIVKQINIPLIADIHFSKKLALLAIENGAAKIRLNPGNIKNEDDVVEIIELAKKNNVAIRIGVNSGSVPKEIIQSNDLKMSSKIMLDLLDNYIKIFEKHDFHNLVLALKSSSPLITLECYRQAARRYKYPLHIGVTESSIKDIGLIRSTIALAPLLMEGIGNTIRISLSDDPVEEIYAAKRLLHDLGLYKDYYTLISCPMCGRTTADTKDIATKVMGLLEQYKLNITVACMGCVVNGIGEGMQADLGIACAKLHTYVIFKKGQVIETVNQEELFPHFEEHLKSFIK